MLVCVRQCHAIDRTFVVFQSNKAGVMRPLAAIVIPAVLLLLPLGGLAQGPASAGDAADAIQCLHAPHGLEEERFVRLGGIDQWITIKGRNCSNPQVPVFLLQGAQDLVTTADVSMRYFDAIEAPNKDYVLLERTGHNPNQAMVEATYKVLIGQVVPLIR